MTARWAKSEERLLILIERPDPEDINQSKLMAPGHGSGRDTVINATANSISGVIQYALSENQSALNSHAFGVALFSSATWPSILAELKPTKVLLCGFRVGGFIFPSDEYLKYRQGNPLMLNGVNYCQTLPIDQLLYNKDHEDSDSSNADLLYMVSRALSNLIRGYNPESLKDLVAKPVLIDDMVKFDKLMSLLERSDEFALDLETNNLSTYHNKVLTAQFATSTTKGYILPIQHTNSPFNEDEQRVIRKRFRALMAGTGKLIYVFNGKFDQRILRHYLNLPVIDHNFWEVTAAEHALDENIGLLDTLSFRTLGNKSIKTKFGNLRNMLCLYGNDRYYTMPFSKEQRVTISYVNIMENKDCQDYCALDPQATLALGLKQRERAKRTRVFVNDEWVNFSRMFEAHVIHQMGVTTKTLSTMEEYGTFQDMKYMKELQDPTLSKLVPLMKSLKTRLYAMDTVKQAERKLNGDKGQNAKALFKVSAVTSAFQIKPAHLVVLFFDILKLKPLRRTETGNPSADKDFLAEYRDLHEEADVIAEYNEAHKLLSTYVGSWQTSIENNLDGQVDLCLRPSFGFFSVVTGRLSSFDPNLQNVPTRGKLAKIIKRMTISPKGHLGPRWDFSAHEVRMWGNSAHDRNVAESFIQGLKLRRKLIQNPTDELRKELKTKGDFHIQNVWRFFKQWVDKKHPLRDAIKAVVFGVIYGKSAITLGRDLQKTKIKEIKAAIKALKSEISKMGD